MKAEPRWIGKKALLLLGLNGYRLAAGHVNSLQTVLALADGTLDEPGLSAWIEEHMERQEP